MREKNLWAVGMGRAALLGGFLVAASAPAWAQTVGATGASSPDAAVTVAVQELKQQVGELRTAVAEMRAEAAQYRQETAGLRRELQDLRGQAGAASVEAKSYPNPSRPEPSRARRVSLGRPGRVLAIHRSLLGSVGATGCCTAF